MTPEQIYREAILFYRPNPTPSKEQAALWLREMQRFAAEDVAAAWEHLKRNQQRFPTTAEWAAYASSFADRREAEAQRQAKKDEAANAQAFFHGSQTDKHSNNALVLIRAMLAGKLTREKYLQGMRHLDMYGESAKLGDWYERNGLPLDKKPHAAALLREETA